jgi:hypothetical protein
VGEVERERGSSRQQKKSYGEIQVQKCCEICVLFRASFSSGGRLRMCISPNDSGSSSLGQPAIVSTKHFLGVHSLCIP